MIILLIIGITLVVVDQALKTIVMGNLTLNEVIDLYLIKFEYIQKNTILFDKDMNIVLIVLWVLLAALFAYWFLTKFAVNVRSKYNYIPFILVLSGIAGNIIDRIIRGFTITYIKIPLLLQDISFNFADICLVIGLFLTVIFYLLKVNTDAFNKMDINSIKKKEKRK